MKKKIRVDLVNSNRIHQGLCTKQSVCITETLE